VSELVKKETRDPRKLALAGFFTDVDHRENLVQISARGKERGFQGLDVARSQFPERLPGNLAKAQLAW
jgi:hypothetical protein